MKKPNRTKELEAKLAAAETSVANLTARLEKSEAMVAGYRKAQTTHEAELKQAEARMGKALGALRPFLTKTVTWEQWPAPEIAVWRPLTFGDLKQARDTAAELLS
jgi:hypothetical protein